MRLNRRIRQLCLAATVLVMNIHGADAQTSPRIHDITGSGYLSPLADKDVSDVPGIVTAVTDKGFFIQDPTPDNDVATSEGLYVSAGQTPSVTIGDSVLVSGTVKEYRPGQDDPNTLPVTEIGGAVKIMPLSSGNALPLPIVLGKGGRLVPTRAMSHVTGDVEKSGTFDPLFTALDFYRSLEGMLVQVNNAVVVSPTDVLGAIVVLGDGGAQVVTRSVRGCPIRTSDGNNPARLILDNSVYKILFASASFSTLDVDDKFTSPLVGVLDYNFDTFRILITRPFATASGRLQRQTVQKSNPNQLSVATLNVDNLNPTTLQEKLDRLAGLVVNNLRAPDILLVDGVEDQSGEVDDGTVDATASYAKLLDAIKRAGGPTYDFRQIDPANDQDGGPSGANSRQGFLFNPARVTFTDRPGGMATTAESVVRAGAQALFAINPGRIDPENAVWSNSFKPLAGEFGFNGHRLFLIATHLIARDGDQPDFGRYQPTREGALDQRIKQAEAVHTVVKQILTFEPNAYVVVAGDMNDTDYSLPALALAGKELYPLMSILPKYERFSYNFQGNCQAFDQMLVTYSLLRNADIKYQVVHVNAEFADRTSEHDPLVARLTLPK